MSTLSPALERGLDLISYPWFPGEPPRDDEMAEIDPATRLYPFALAACGKLSDLNAVYQLLCRNPAPVLELIKDYIGSPLKCYSVGQEIPV